MANAMRRVTSTARRAVSVATLIAAAGGGAFGGGVASAGAPAQFRELPAEAGTPPGMQFSTDAPRAGAKPDSVVTVKMSLTLARMSVMAPRRGIAGGQIEFLQGLQHFESSKLATIKLDGYRCEDYDDAMGTLRVTDGQQDGRDVDGAAFATFVQGIIANMGKGADPAADLARLRSYSLVASCRFRVPADLVRNIEVAGVVQSDGGNAADLAGRAVLPVDLPKAPDAPAVDGPDHLVVHEGGGLTGTGPRDTLIRWNIDGARVPVPTAYVGHDGKWALRVPPSVPADGKPHQVFVTSETSDGKVTGQSAGRRLTVLPALARPVITDPEGGVVSPGQVVTVSGSNGATVTPVDKNGEPLGPPATIENGTARVSLNKDVPLGTAVRMRATDAATPVSDALFSDLKMVEASAPSRISVLWAPSAAPGEDHLATFAIQPENGDLSSVVGKKITVKAPDGFTFQPISDEKSTVRGRFNITANASDKDGRNNGKCTWLADLVSVSPDGKTMTFVFPAVDPVSREDVVKKLSGGDYPPDQLQVTFHVTADTNATAGEKTGGQVTVDGFGTAQFTGRVTA
ncbi:hypothetical protein [Amycolatopsis sp. La24]|uniref:hypothetical protein n=1 Tax=Amycolatopsis sp. La24 TaxID=3028304 RepID=UPI0023B1AC04|nr:hypothetical protein [Amycolatopsis sp. La24]